MDPLWLTATTVTLFGKKKLGRRDYHQGYALLDITLNDDDGLLNLRCTKRGTKCKQSLEKVMIDLTKFKRSVAVLQSELSLHAIVIS